MIIANIPKKLASGDAMFYFSSKHKKKTNAIKKANKIRNKGKKARVQYLNINGKRIYLVYKGPKRKTEWSGYGKGERPGP